MLDFAPWEHIHDYLQQYADHFGVTKRIRFCAEVISIDKTDFRNANLPWTIQVMLDGTRVETMKFDFVVVATGLFSTPYVPKIKGEENFAGPIVHGCDIKTPSQVADKRVIIIGAGKCAIDMAVLAGQIARTCHMVLRRAHWPIPYKILGGRLPFHYSYTRILSALLDPFPHGAHGYLFSLIHRIFAKVFDKLSDLMSADVIASFDQNLFVDKVFLPTIPYRNIETALRISDDFIRLKTENRIIAKLASIDEITDQTTVRLTTGESLQADLIICATGFIERFPFFSQSFSELLGIDKTNMMPSVGAELDLYRRLVPVGIPNIGFVGFISSAHQWIFFEVMSHWLSDYFLGCIALPSEEKMYDEIRTTRAFIRKQFNRSLYFYQYYWLEPLEIYLNDMGVSLHRTHNWVSEYFGVYWAKRFKSLHQERRAKREQTLAHLWYRYGYFGFWHTMMILILIFFYFCYLY